MSGIPTLNPLSPEAASIFHLFIAILLVMLAIFVLVAALVTVAVIRYRDREGAADARQEFGNTRLEIIWTVIPALLLIVIFGFTVRTIHASDPSVAGHAPDLRVIGHQWWWEADYLGSGVVAANEIHIPTGRPILIDFESADVIHDFWVPELGRKIDAIPGHPNHIWIRPTSPASTLEPARSSAAIEHAWMRIIVIAQTPEDFAAWQRAQLVVPAVPTAGAAARARNLSRPDLRQLSHDRRHAGQSADRSRSDPSGGPEHDCGGSCGEHSRQSSEWLKDPNSIKPESHMPELQAQPTRRLTRSSPTWRRSSERPG